LRVGTVDRERRLLATILIVESETRLYSVILPRFIEGFEPKVVNIVGIRPTCELLQVGLLVGEVGLGVRLLGAIRWPSSLSDPHWLAVGDSY